MAREVEAAFVYTLQDRKIIQRRAFQHREEALIAAGLSE
jgi:hypothetical protein